MRPIQMVDTRTQYHKIKEEVDKAVLDVMESTSFINGQPVHDFATNLSAYTGSAFTIPCANGSDALQVAMMALGLKPGDEVITPSFTFIATTEVIALLGITPVFAEVDERHFCIDPSAIEKLITPKTKAIVPVHLFGQSADMEPIMNLAKKHNLFVIEDNAQAIGCDYSFSDGTKMKTGTIGHIGTTSFYPAKNLGAFGDGGAIFTQDENLATRMRMIANHGQRARYYHDIVGCNSRLDSMQAAVLDIKLKKLDSYIDARRKAASFYDKAIGKQAGIRIPYRAGWCDHTFHQYTIVVENGKRDGLHAYLAAQKIPSMIYYPVPNHQQKMFEGISRARTTLPVTEKLSEQVLSLPMHTELDEEQLGYISGKILEYLNQ